MNLTIKEAAKKLGVQQYVLYNFVKQNNIKIVRNPMRVDYYELSKQFRIHKKKIRKHNIRRYEKPSGELTPDQKKNISKIKYIITERASSGSKTFAEIGRRYGISRQAVYDLWKKYKDDPYYKEVSGEM